MATRIDDPERLRHAALHSQCDEFGFGPEFDGPFLVMMDIGQIRGTSTLIAIRDRNPSLFITADGSVLCSLSDKVLRRIANRLVDAASIFMPLMETCESFEKPSWGKVRLTVRTPSEIVFAEQAQLRMTTGISAFSVLYDLCGDLIEELSCTASNSISVPWAEASSVTR